MSNFSDYNEVDDFYLLGNKKENKMSFEFLKSIRFWKLFAVAVVEFLAAQGIIDPALAHSIAFWLGGSVVVGTYDKGHLK